jgi:DnaD/phage-associated family protein
MPKGDKYILKADPEDGTTPIANLLLEAVAMSKLSGLQKGAIIYLWRRTYGWVGENGKRLKEAKISLSEWAKALDSTKSRLSHTLAELETYNILHRRIEENWGGYFYSLNTEIASWNHGKLNLSLFAETQGVAENATIDESATVDEKDNSCEVENSCQERNATVAENATQQLPKTQLCSILYKEIIKKDIKKDAVKKMQPQFGDDLRKIFYELDHNLRKYKVPKRNAEAASIMRMLKNNYTVDQIIKAWKEIKKRSFYQKAEVYMMTVESNIGAIVNDGNNKQLLDETEDSKKFGEVCKIYENEIGLLTPMIGEELNEASKIYPLDWFKDAIKEAADHNARNLKYVIKILETWQKQGRGDNHNGEHQSGNDAIQTENGVDKYTASLRKRGLA